MIGIMLQKARLVLDLYLFICCSADSISVNLISGRSVSIRFFAG